MDAEPKTFTPPYNIPWATFLSTLERMAADPPNRVDRTYLDSQSGTVQTYLIAAYKTFGLISEDARPTEAVHTFADPDARKGMVADLIRKYYPTILPLGNSNSTPGELAEAFSAAFPSLTGESRVKAIRFFLSAAAYADLKLSPMWKAPKAPRGNSASRRNRKPSAASASNGTAGSSSGRSAVKTIDEMKADYFALLLKKADAGDGDDTDLLDRIERLVGLEPGRKENRDRKTAGSKPATPPGPASQGEG